VSTLYYNQALFLLTEIASAALGEDEYLLGALPNGTPLVRSKTTGQTFILAWKEIIQAARRVGVDKTMPEGVKQEDVDLGDIFTYKDVLDKVANNRGFADALAAVKAHPLVKASTSASLEVSAEHKRDLAVMSVDREHLAQAVARAWCHEKNAYKVMDTDLAEAIVDELLKMPAKEKLQ